jgi:hypothetical protein
MVTTTLWHNQPPQAAIQGIHTVQADTAAAVGIVPCMVVVDTLQPVHYSVVVPEC